MFVGAGWKDETRQLFHDSNSQRGGVLMHAKVSLSIVTQALANAFAGTGNHL